MGLLLVHVIVTEMFCTNALKKAIVKMVYFELLRTSPREGKLGCLGICALGFFGAEGYFWRHTLLWLLEREWMQNRTTTVNEIPLLTGRISLYITLTLDSLFIFSVMMRLCQETEIGKCLLLCINTKNDYVLYSTIFCQSLTTSVVSTHQNCIPHGIL